MSCVKSPLFRRGDLYNHVEISDKIPKIYKKAEKYQYKRQISEYLARTSCNLLTLLLVYNQAEGNKGKTKNPEAELQKRKLQIQNFIKKQESVAKQVKACDAKLKGL